jgi:hypothetical protein
VQDRNGNPLSPGRCVTGEWRRLVGIPVAQACCLREPSERPPEGPRAYELQQYGPLLCRLWPMPATIT